MSSRGRRRSTPAVSTLERLVELTHEVDFAAFVFAQDDWTTNDVPADSETHAQASPRDNVVFEAGLFGGVLGMRRTFILHANGAKLPSDLLGLTCVRYDVPTTPGGDPRRSTRSSARRSRPRDGIAAIEGLWWQYSLTARSELSRRPSASCGSPAIAAAGWRSTGDSWQEDGTLSARYRSEASKEKTDPSGVRLLLDG